MLKGCNISPVFACLLAGYSNVMAAPGGERLERDLADGKAIVVHVLVALADNRYQGIVPVPAAIGNGQDPRSNLYWGALYGLKTHLTRKAAWQKLSSRKPGDKRILERLILKKTFSRDGRNKQVYLVADAWDGRYISDTIEQFLRFNGGHDIQRIALDGKNLQAGGKAHLLAYIGHNAYMDYAGAKGLFSDTPAPAKDNPQNDAIVLACKSQPYFSQRLQQLAARPLVLTRGLMAPEAYSLNAAIDAWIKGSSVKQVRKAAAASYNQYQKTGSKAAEWLFGVN